MRSSPQGSGIERAQRECAVPRTDDRRAVLLIDPRLAVTQAVSGCERPLDGHLTGEPLDAAYQLTPRQRPGAADGHRIRETYDAVRRRERRVQHVRVAAI